MRAGAAAPLIHFIHSFLKNCSDVLFVRGDGGRRRKAGASAAAAPLPDFIHSVSNNCSDILLKANAAPPHVLPRPRVASRGEDTGGEDAGGEDARGEDSLGGTKAAAAAKLTHFICSFSKKMF